MLQSQASFDDSSTKNAIEYFQVLPFAVVILLAAGVTVTLTVGSWWEAIFAGRVQALVVGLGFIFFNLLLWALNRKAIQDTVAILRVEAAEQELAQKKREEHVQEQVLDSYRELAALLYKVAESLTRGRLWGHILKTAARHPKDDGFEVYNLKVFLKTVRIILTTLNKLDRAIEADARGWVESDLKFAASMYTLKDDVLVGWNQILPILLTILNGTEDRK